MSNARFSILQARAISDKRITDAQFRTLASLGMYADRDGWCFPSLTRIGADCNKSKQAAGRDIIHLKKCGYVEVYPQFDKQTGSRRPNKYRLKFDPPVNVDDSTPSTPEVDTPSTPEVDTTSTPEVDVNVPVNTPIKNTSYNRGEQEKPDVIKAMLDMTVFPGAKISARVDALLSAYGVAFVVNSETKEWKTLAKYAIGKQVELGWNPETFIEWVKKQDGYPTYWTAKRMLSEYPKAYEKQAAQKEEIIDWQDRSHAL